MENKFENKIIEKLIFRYFNIRSTFQMVIPNFEPHPIWISPNVFDQF